MASSFIFDENISEFIKKSFKINFLEEFPEILLDKQGF